MQAISGPSLTSIGQHLVDDGISFVPIKCDGSKQPATSVLPKIQNENGDKLVASWKPLQERLPTKSELAKWLNKSEYGIAAICGKVSGNLECIDVDDPSIVNEIILYVNGLDADRLISSVITPTGGLHLWYRCSEIESNQVLAHYTREGKKKTRIETRGEGGYALIPGCPASCHPSGNTYEYNVGSLKLWEIRRNLSPQYRSELLNYMRSFEEIIEPQKQHNQNQNSDSTAHDFDLRGPSFPELLASTGANTIGQDLDRGRLTRPGKNYGVSATYGFCKGANGEPLLYVFTGNWPPFESGKTYGKFHVYRLIHCQGDGSRALRELNAKGFGTQKVNSGPSRHKANEQVQVVEAWEDPIPLESGTIEVPNFPLYCLPTDIANLCESIAKIIGTPTGFPATAIIGVAAGAIGASACVEITKSYTEPCCLYTLLVGNPGSRKSPVLKKIMNPVFAEQRIRVEEKSTHHAFISDVTVEKIAEFHNEDERGVFIFRDEFSAVLKSFGQYKGGLGADRQYHLDAHSGTASKIDRKDPNSKSVFVPHPVQSILGGIQHDVFTDVSKGARDGFFDRFLYSVLPEGIRIERPKKIRLTIDENLMNLWEQTYVGLAREKMQEDLDSKKYAYRYKLTDGAVDEAEKFRDYIDNHLATNLDYACALGTIDKLDAQSFRLALVVHLLRMQCNEGGILKHDPIDDVSMGFGIEIAKYYLGHALFLFGSKHDSRKTDAQKILDWILKQPKELKVINRRNLYRALRRQFESPESLKPGLALLEFCRYLRILRTDEQKGIADYEINPTIR